AEISTLGEVYEQLMRCEASKRGKKKKPVSFGPTGAAKILFALRPKAVLLWDTAIRKEKGYDGSRESYESFLKYLQTELKALELECKKYGFSLSELPKKLQTKGDDILTVPKLLDEYYWLTITQGYSIPTLQILKGWLKLF
ncbi:MAG: hypothetical protein U9Q76_03965, partial [candidate division WOR-3 bacterium]|nr:hypothetical protein [candidate division WOR-3 bacterium]